MTELQTRLSWPSGVPRSAVSPLDPLPATLPQKIALDIESDGLGGDSLPVGVTVATDRWSCYLPWGHAEGAQHDHDAVRRWLRDQLRGREVWFRNAKQDLRWLRRDGVDLEALGVKPHEVQHAAALLDDRRRVFTLEALAQDRLGIGKLPAPPGLLYEQPADVVADYARRDGRLTYDLGVSYAPAITREGLDAVLKLEDDLIYCVLAMEEARVRLDMPKLARWDSEVEQAYLTRVLELCRRVKGRVNPNSGKDLHKLFKQLGLAVPQKFDEHSQARRDSFEEELLLPLAGHWAGKGKARRFTWTNRELRLVIEAKQLDSLRSKYLTKYLRAVDARGYLPYQLHQLRADEGGTIMGRFASSKVNIQQVLKPDKQAAVTNRWLVRELFLPGEDAAGWLSADASQIEFRMLAHYAAVSLKKDRLARAYREDPNVDFHDLVTEKILRHLMPRVLTKNFNFMKIYGGGVDKVAFMTGLDPATAEQRNQEYDREFPEARELMRVSSRLAERRGYVRTYLGRRRRYREGDKFYSALHSVLSGTAADIMKKKLLRVYNERAALNFKLRFTVHDELNGDRGNRQTESCMRECLAEQELALQVPITWKTGIGANWKEAMK